MTCPDWHCIVVGAITSNYAHSAECLQFPLPVLFFSYRVVGVQEFVFAESSPRRRVGVSANINRSDSTSVAVAVVRQNLSFG
jgi:hypothetical protein